MARGARPELFKRTESKVTQVPVNRENISCLKMFVADV
jgi:hypothetical protein